MVTAEAVVQPATARQAAVKDSFTVWQEFFRRWPAELPQRGVLVTTTNEQIPFAGFLASETMVLLDRPAPDTVGARKVLLSYHAVAAVKLTDVLKEKPFTQAGFAGKLPK